MSEARDRPPLSAVSLTPGDPLAGLGRWIAEGRVDDAARARARERWLLRQAAEDATLVGVLIDLGERERPVLLTTRRGRAARGPVRAVGADFCVVREANVGDVIVPVGAIASVRAATGESSVVTARPVNLDVVFAEALVELAADRPMVLVAAGDADHRGELRSAGRDVVSIGLDGTSRETIHVSTEAVDHVIVLLR